MAAPVLAFAAAMRGQRRGAGLHSMHAGCHTLAVPALQPPMRAQQTGGTHCLALVLLSSHHVAAM